MSQVRTSAISDRTHFASSANAVPTYPVTVNAASHPRWACASFRIAVGPRSASANVLCASTSIPRPSATSPAHSFVGHNLLCSKNLGRNVVRVRIDLDRLTDPGTELHGNADVRRDRLGLRHPCLGGDEFTGERTQGSGDHVDLVRGLGGSGDDAVERCPELVACRALELVLGLRAAVACRLQLILHTGCESGKRIGARVARGGIAEDVGVEAHCPPAFAISCAL